MSDVWLSAAEARDVSNRSPPHVGHTGRHSTPSWWRPSLSAATSPPQAAGSNSPTPAGNSSRSQHETPMGSRLRTPPPPRLGLPAAHRRRLGHRLLPHLPRNGPLLMTTPDDRATLCHEHTHTWKPIFEDEKRVAHECVTTGCDALRTEPIEWAWSA